MNFDIKKTLLYSDTLLPDIFISEYLPILDGDSLKIYIYCVFLAKYNKPFNITDLSKKFNLSSVKIRELLGTLQSMGLIIQNENSITFNDLKERAVFENYRVRQSSDPDKCLASLSHKKRNKVIRSINNNFFQGVMPPSWYTDIDSWFERFHFEDDAMYMLFQHCYDYGVLQKNYILKVAQVWHSRGITTSIDVENYYQEYQKMKDVSYKIMKKLNRKTPLTSYESEMVQKWVLDFGYNFDIIDIALQKTTGTFNPSFNYINSIIESWHNANLHNVNDIINYNKSSKEKYSKNKVRTVNNKATYKNFEQRHYDDAYFETFYHNSDNANDGR